MPAAGPARVPLLEVDPDLARGLDDEQLAAAQQRLTVPVVPLRRGTWTPPSDAVDGSAPPFALLVLDGLLVRQALVGEHPSAELLGPGDLLRVADESEGEALLPRSVEWTVLHPGRVALIGLDLLAAAPAWPEVAVALIDRAARRADRLVVLQAITHLTRVDDRLLALLWYLAERWGRVVPGGVALTLRLPHRTLAGMVGARRPSVTTALGQLLARGDLSRRSDGAWVMRGGPPEHQVGAAPSVALPLVAADG